MEFNTADVRRFMTDYFSDEELSTLCFDFFPDAYESFTSGMSKGQKIQIIIEYCRRHERLTGLLKVLRQQRSEQFTNRWGQTDAVQLASSLSLQESVNDASVPSSVSGGIDVVGRDKITRTTSHITHATSIQSESSIQDIKPTSESLPHMTSISLNDGRSKFPGEVWLSDQNNRRVISGVEFVRIPGGKFLMGSSIDNANAHDDEYPLHIVNVPYDYWIGRYPVSNEQFEVFANATQYITTAETEGGWNGKTFEAGIDWRHPYGSGSTIDTRGNYPVVQVSWHDAIAYCKWLNDLMRAELRDLALRLPTEAEWEKAARGVSGFEWPWGNEFDINKCNSYESGNRKPTPVGAYSPHGDSPYGVADMAGNVWDWCHSIKLPYPYYEAEGREHEATVISRVLRGGAFDYNQWGVRTASRELDKPSNRFDCVGFRVTIAPTLYERVSTYTSVK